MSQSLNSASSNLSSSPPIPLPVGYRLAGRYEVEDWLEGRAAVVHRVRDTKTGRKYALKALLPYANRSVRERRFFFDELHTSIVLPTNGHLVQAYLAFNISRRTYFLMEYVEGNTLREVLSRRQGSLPVSEALSYGFQICQGMWAASSRGEVAHLDLKPANIFVTPQNRVKIGDFGFTRGTSAFAGAQIRFRAGTASYMSPEQFLNKPVSTSSDIFSFGIIFYEMLTGKLPYPIILTGNAANDRLRLAFLHRLLLRQRKPNSNEIEQFGLDLNRLEMAWAREDSEYSLSFLSKQGLEETLGRIVAGCLCSYPEGRWLNFSVLVARFLDRHPELKRTTQQPFRNSYDKAALAAYLRYVSCQAIGQNAKATEFLNTTLVQLARLGSQELPANGKIDPEFILRALKQQHKDKRREFNNIFDVVEAFDEIRQLELTNE